MMIKVGWARVRDLADRAITGGQAFAYPPMCVCVFITAGPMIAQSRVA
jgi:hypothetical protein